MYNGIDRECYCQISVIMHVPYQSIHFPGFYYCKFCGGYIRCGKCDSATHLTKDHFGWDEIVRSTEPLWKSGFPL